MCVCVKGSVSVEAGKRYLSPTARLLTNTPQFPLYLTHTFALVRTHTPMILCPPRALYTTESPNIVLFLLLGLYLFLTLCVFAWQDEAEDFDFHTIADETLEDLLGMFEEIVEEIEVCESEN